MSLLLTLNRFRLLSSHFHRWLGTGKFQLQKGRIKEVEYGWPLHCSQFSFSYLVNNMVLATNAIAFKYSPKQTCYKTFINKSQKNWLQRRHFLVTFCVSTRNFTGLFCRHFFWVLGNIPERRLKESLLMRCLRSYEFSTFYLLKMTFLTETS